jgi:plastocyanin
MSKLSLLVSCSALLSFAACSSDDPDDGGDDVPGGVAVEADCAMATKTVVTAGNAYSPASTTIEPGEVVKFMMPASHDVASSTSGLTVTFGATKCLKFATAGTYTFNCTPHGFTGTVKVE